MYMQLSCLYGAGFSHASRSILGWGSWICFIQCCTVDKLYQCWMHQELATYSKLESVAKAVLVLCGFQPSMLNVTTIFEQQNLAQPHSFVLLGSTLGHLFHLEQGSSAKEAKLERHLKSLQTNAICTVRQRGIKPSSNHKRRTTMLVSSDLPLCFASFPGQHDTSSLLLITAAANHPSGHTSLRKVSPKPGQEKQDKSVPYPYHVKQHKDAPRHQCQ